MKVTIDEVVKDYPAGITYEELAGEYQEQYQGLIALVCVNGKIRELMKKLDRDCTLRFFTLQDDIGHKTYVRTATMLLMKAIRDVCPDTLKKCSVEYTIGHGYYVRPEDGVTVSAQDVEKIRQRMHELVQAKQKIHKRSYPVADAIELFKEQGMRDKEILFKYRRSSYVNVYEMDGYYDYYYGSTWTGFSF